jgi:hypothetical protein
MKMSTIHVNIGNHQERKNKITELHHETKFCCIAMYDFSVKINQIMLEGIPIQVLELVAVQEVLAV